MQFRREREVSSNTHRLQNVELVLRACNHDEFFVTTRRVHCHYSPAGGMWRKSLTLNDLSPQLKCGLPIYPFCLMLHCQLSIRLQITHFATFMSFQFVKKNSSRASASRQHRKHNVNTIWAQVFLESELEILNFTFWWETHSCTLSKSSLNKVFVDLHVFLTALGVSDIYQI